MSSTMRFAVMLVWGGLASGSALSAQTEVALAGGVGTVRTSDGASATAATLAPTVRVQRRWTAAGAQATIAALPRAEWNAQLHLDAWQALASGERGFALALAGAFAGSAGPGDARAGAAQALAEVVYQRSGRGAAIGAGPVLGAIGGAAPVTAPRLAGRGWLRSGSWRYAITIESTRLRSGWYADANPSASFERGSFTAALAAAGRVIAGDKGRATGTGFAAWRLGTRVVLEGSYGGFLSDPFLGFTRATSASIAARVGLGPRSARVAAPLIARRRGDQLIVRVRVRHATTVALAGEWDEWTPMPLRRVTARGDVWEGVVVLAPGTYRFNLVVDGGRWTVPDGVAGLADEFGGRAAMLVVPVPRRP